MKYFQEVTKWDAGYQVPNHIYYMKDDRSFAVGYIKVGTKKLNKFSKPMRIDIRGRKFVLVDKIGEKDTVYFPKTEDEKPSSIVKTVEGSSGKKYYITGSSGKWVCSCPGFQFRRKCRHIGEVN